MNAAYLPLVALVLQDTAVPVTAVEHSRPKSLLRLAVDLSLR
jgi:hypothetical protein